MNNIISPIIVTAMLIFSLTFNVNAENESGAEENKICEALSVVECVKISSGLKMLISLNYLEIRFTDMIIRKQDGN